MRAFSARFDRVSFYTAGSLALLAGLYLGACSQSADPDGGLSSSSGSGSGATSGSGASGGTGSTSAAGGSTGGSINIDGGAISDSGVFDAGCASHTEAAEIQPVHLVFLMDRSGSMVGADIGEELQAVKWDPVLTALKGFFVDPTSMGLTASMIMFPAEVTQPDPDAGPGPGPGFPGMNNYQCGVDQYSTAAVAATALPSPAFGAALDLTDPDGLGTPTQPSLAGAIVYVEAQKAVSPDHKFVIVMVTDGVPQGCMGNTIATASAEAAAVAAEIPTYVIGVGDSLDNLNAIAEAGGTGQAILVAIDDPVKTQSDLTTAINDIRGKEIACNITLPVPPAGEAVDPFKVNVSLTPSNGEPQVLTYDQTCAAGGWRYDDPQNPTAIELCETTCGAVTADHAKELSIILGCATEVPK